MLILRIGPAEVFAKQTSPEEARITALVDHSFIKTSANASVDDVDSAFEGYDASELRTFLEESPHWVVGTRCARSLATLLCCIVPIVTCGSTKVLCCGCPFAGRFRVISLGSSSPYSCFRSPQGYIDGDDWRFAKRNHADQHILAVSLVDALATLHEKGVSTVPSVLC